MKENWERAITFVLKEEIPPDPNNLTGYVNDPNDPGGETNFGISKKSYPKLDIKSLTREQAIEIYKRDYWNVIDGDNLPTPFDVILFDTGVNCGTGTAKRLYSSYNKDWKDFLLARIDYYMRLKNAKYSLITWCFRVVHLWKLICSSIDWEINK